MNLFMILLGGSIVLDSIYRLKTLQQDEMFRRSKLFFSFYIVLGVCSIIIGSMKFSCRINEILVWSMFVLHSAALIIVPKKKR